MAITHEILTQATVGGTSISVIATQTVEFEAKMDRSIAIGATNLELPFTCESTNLKSWVILSDKALTVKTNSSSTPQETITLVANVPQVWQTGMGTAPIAGDVTKLFVTNASGAIARLQLAAGWTV